MSDHLKSLLLEKLRAACFHFLFTCIVSILSALLIFYIWFPAPYTNISGGIDLWVILVGVELTLGPLMSLVIYSSTKSLRSLVVDYSMVGLVQFCALFYGVSTLYSVRPVFMVFVVDRFELVSEMAFTEVTWAEAKKWRSGGFGPTVLGVREAQNAEERDELMFEAVSTGKDIHLRPKYYKQIDPVQVSAKTKSVSELIEKLKGSKYDYLSSDLSQYKGYVWLPAAQSYNFWIAVLDPVDLSVVGLYPIDPWELKII